MTSGPGNSSRPESGDQVAGLIAKAGPRPTPDASVEASVRAAVEREWSKVANARRRTRYWMATSAAAALAAIAVLGWLELRTEPAAPAGIVATLVASRGPVRIASGPPGALTAVGDALLSGATVRTGPGGAAALSVAAVAVRLGPETVVTLDRPGEIGLVSGRLYVDSGPGGLRGETLWVETPFGGLTHLGTQFQVLVVAGQYLSVGVREGRVRARLSGQSPTIGRGEGLRVDGTGAISRLAVAPYDAAWSWVNEFVPDYSIEGQALSTFLDWFARETGRALVFVAPATRDAAGHTTLKGTISGLTPVQALDAVLATTQFRYDVGVPGQVRIGLRATGDDRQRANAEAAAVPAGPAR